jgi:DNA-binding NtrC family response regulator
MLENHTVTLDWGEQKQQPPSAVAPGVFLLFSEGEILGNGLYYGREKTTIGREPDQDIYIKDQGLSRRHAILSFQEAEVTLRDLDSHNGTFLNGRRIRGNTAASYGDVIRCGSTILILLRNIEDFRGWPFPSEASSMLGGAEIQAIIKKATFIGPQGMNVLITGESGTGKELVANYLHRMSGRRGLFLSLNCAAIPKDLFEAELFGVKKGAFTGATEDRLGQIREAQGGSLFLDELGEMPLFLQPKLLRVLEQRQLRPVGGNQSYAIDVRFISATNRNLVQEAEQGHFREDLYYRLSGYHIHIPPLRQRRQDIYILAKHFLERFFGQSHSQVPPLKANFVEALLSAQWPGNVRQLERTIYEVYTNVILQGSAQLTPDQLSPDLFEVAKESNDVEYICEVLRMTDGNVSEAAHQLKLGRSKLYGILKEHGLRAANFRQAKR